MRPESIDRLLSRDAALNSDGIKKPSILLVDDQQSYLDTTKESLEDDGYEVTTASDGETAIKIASEKKFDLVLLDIVMNRVNDAGLKVKEGLDGVCPDTPVILVTAHVGEPYSIEDLQVSHDPYSVVNKGDTYIAVRAAVKRCIDHQNLLQFYASREGFAKLGQNLASVLHETSNGQQVIYGAATLIERISDDPRTLKFIRKIMEESQRQIELVKRLKKIGKTEYSTRDFDVNAFIEDNAGILLTSKGKGVSVVKDYDPEIPKVSGDQTYLTGVILNLIDNALDAVQGIKNPQVTLSTSHDPQFVYFRVGDNGPGINPVILEQIFNPYVTTKKDGAGIGLSYSKMHVEGHGGTLTAVNKPDGGVLMTVKLPYKPA
ncbi:ATP-binding protein [Nanoarchaeota archaeon]